MSHTPTSLDVASDLRRCVYASLSSDGFEDKMYQECLQDALTGLDQIKGKLNKNIYLSIYKLIHKQNKDIRRRREDLLTASIILLS